MRASGLALFLIIATLASADVTTSALTGRVRIGDAPAAGVTVKAESPALQHPRTTFTSPRGTYWLEALAPGEYEVTFTLAGHTTHTRTAIVQLGRVARADATLEPSDDEETVTSTATSVDAASTTAITTHFDDAFLDKLPQGRDSSGRLIPDPSFGGWEETDDVPFFSSQAEDLIEEVTVFRGGSAAEYELISGTVLETRTRHGREDFFGSLRGTPWDDSRSSNSLEGTAGGRILPQRLWFFAAGWGNGFSRGANAKLHLQLGAAHHLDANVTTGRFDPSTDRFFNNRSSLRHTMVAGPYFSAETEAATTAYGRDQGFRKTRYEADFLSSRASYVIPAASGDHVVTASLRHWEGDGGESRAYSLADRWSTTHWVVSAGAQYESRWSEELMPRIAVNFDPAGDGRQAFAGSWGRHGFGDLTTIGYAAAFGSSGAMRVDLLRRDEGLDDITHSLQVDARYRLFNRFETGATGSLTDGRVSVGGVANVWLGLSLPVLGNEFGITVFERARKPYDRSDDTKVQTDLALRYSMSFARVAVTIAADGADLFQQGTFRRNRVWVRLLFR